MSTGVTCYVEDFRGAGAFGSALARGMQFTDKLGWRLMPAQIVMWREDHPK